MAPPLNHDALFEATLPKDLLDQLDLTTLVLVSGSFVDEELRASLTDLRFTAKLAKGDESSTTAPRVGKSLRGCDPFSP